MLLLPLDVGGGGAPVQWGYGMGADIGADMMVVLRSLGTASAFGIVAGIAAMTFLCDVPKVQKNIMQVGAPFQ